MRVLLIEPDVPLSNIYAKALVSGGFQVAVARSAQQAVHLADRNSPDVVVMEMQLKQHNGVAFMQEFRSYPDWCNIPIIVHTTLPAFLLKEFDVALAEMGVSKVLYKPSTSLKQLVAEAGQHTGSIKHDS